MPPILHIIRHAQGLHNVNHADHNLQDPSLTPYGIQQSKDIAKVFPIPLHSIDLIISSPLRRAVYTALCAFEPIIEEKEVNVIAQPLLQEWSDLPCDIPLSTAELQKEFSDAPVDLSLLKGRWNVKEGLYAIGKESIERRAAEARRWLKDLEERNVVVMTHGGFVHYLTGDWEGCDPVRGTAWENGEVRSFECVEEEDGVRLVETGESRKRRIEETDFDARVPSRTLVI